MSKRLKEVPLLPLRGVVVFPHMVVHLDVGRETSIKALEKAMVEGNEIVLVAQKDARVKDPGFYHLYRVGTIARVKQMIKLPGGTNRVLVEGLNRAEIMELITDSPYFMVLANEIVTEKVDNNELEAHTRNLLELFEQYVKIGKKLPPETLVSVTGIQDPGRMADIITSHLSLKVPPKQEILELIVVKNRLERLSEFLERELEILEIERKIGTRVRKQMERNQKEYYLREQVKAIHKELGDKDDRSAEVEEYREKIEEADLPEEVKEKALKDLGRLEKMPPAAAESVVIRNYLDWITELPWNVETEDSLDLDMVQQILDEDHYGLEKVKERIIEFLAIRQLTEKIKGPILCLVGPPGVGKTSLAKSVARAMDRNFVRISLGGVRDEAEIRGHRRTYVGALPGRIIQGMRQAKSKNPVFLLDEIDKMSTDFRGDPSSALLEVLDPEQNNAFSDHFIEVPYDLSKVLFITTANVSFNIPRPLLDRMEMINISGYTEEEKVKITSRHLMPKQIEEHGLTEKNLQVGDKPVRRIIREYTREAGVRNLERNLSAICRKVAREVVKDRELSRRITARGLQRYLGIPRYRYGTAEKTDQVGVSTGMAWTEVGGELLAIEVILMKGKGKMILTGKLGDVMKESAQAALSYIRSREAVLGIENIEGMDNDFHEKTDIHIHIPEGAIPKDGPSAGIAMATAMISSFTKTLVRKDVALTGEITLRGQVLPVGGIKEKVLAAHRAGIKKIIMPADNRRDLSEIPVNVKNDLSFILVDEMDQVLEHVIVDFQGKNVIPAHVAGNSDLNSIDPDNPALSH